jgi:5'-3' exonuclease
VPEELRAQFDAAEEAVRALGVVVWSMAEHEADDALATAAARFCGQVAQVRLLSPDKDLAQCVRGQQVVQVERKSGRVVDEAAVREQRGVEARSIPDLLALTGDVADGIPGLPGFGDKSAAALLARYGHLEAIPAQAQEWQVKVRGAPRLAATLAERRQEALLYRRLATLVEDVPLPEGLEALAFTGVPREPFLAWCEQAKSTSLRERPKRWR